MMDRIGKDTDNVHFETVNGVIFASILIILTILLLFPYGNPPHDILKFQENNRMVKMERIKKDRLSLNNEILSVSFPILTILLHFRIGKVRDRKVYSQDGQDSIQCGRLKITFALQNIF
jgi:hypothetical protein